jgi:hypothetical protein
MWRSLGSPGQTCLIIAALEDDIEGRWGGPNVGVVWVTPGQSAGSGSDPSAAPDLVR